MPDAVAALALVLLVLGVVGSVVPSIPGGVLALTAVYVEYFFGGDRMHVWILASFTVVGLLAVALELFGPAISSKARGASNRTAYAAGVAGLLLFFVAGPVGIVVGIFAVVLWSELRSGKPFDEAWDNAVWGAAGLLASTAAVFLLTLSMLVGYVVFVLWLH